MCLPIRDLESRRLAKGEHAGLEFEVVHNDIGYRCGYVRVLPGHPWFGKGYDEIDADVHGGLTYAEYGTACPTHGKKAEWWVGFDCAHAGDAPDPALLSASSYRPYGLLGDTIKDTDYVIAECRSLAEQAVAACP